MPGKILMFWHCRRCLADIPEGESPATWARLEAGFTLRGIQVRCMRHDLNIIHIDFEGAKHPADLSEAGDFK